MTAPRGIAPSHDDAVVAAASTAIGGASGRHARPHPFWKPVRVVLALATLALALNLVHTAPCQSGAWWSGAAYADLCYSDVPLEYVSGGHAEGLAPYENGAGKYPAATTDPAPVASVEWAAAALARSVTGTGAVLTELDEGAPRTEAPPDQLAADDLVRTEARTYYGIYALVMLVAALAAAAMLTRLSDRRPFDAAAFALAPVLVAAATIGWDLLGVALTVGAGYAWSRGRPVAGGVLLGTAVAAAVWPLALLVAMLALAVRTGRSGPATAAAAATALTWVAWQLPPLLLTPGDWWGTVNHTLDGQIGYGSLWWLVRAYGVPVSSGVLVAAVALAVVAMVGAVLALVRRARPEPRWPQVVLLLLVGGLVVWPVYSPQYVLWLLPFAVLARPRWRDLLWWQAGELGYFLAIWWTLAGATANAGAVDRVYAVAIVVRVVAEVWFAARVVRDIRHPELDPVRAVGDHYFRRHACESGTHPAKFG